MKFYATSKNGHFAMMSIRETERFKDFLNKNHDIKLEISIITPESKKQRNFFEGAIVPLITYYQESMDYKDWRDCKSVREWLLNEFSSEFKVIAGKSVKVRKTSAGELNKGLLERILDWCAENGYQIDVLNPEEYKKWRDTVYLTGEHDNYIDYLLDLRKLRPREYAKTH